MKDGKVSNGYLLLLSIDVYIFDKLVSSEQSYSVPSNYIGLVQSGRPSGLHERPVCPVQTVRVVILMRTVKPRMYSPRQRYRMGARYPLEHIQNKQLELSFKVVTL